MKLHLAVNSGFIQMFANISENIDATNEHHFIVYGEQMTGQVIDKTKLKSNFVITNSLESDNEMINNWVEKSTTIYIHFLTDAVINFLEKFNINKKKIVWFFWGADAFSMPEIYRKLKHYRTDKIKALGGTLKSLFIKKKSAEIKLKFLQKIDFFAHYSMDDFNLIKPLLHRNASFKYFTYGVVESFIDNTYSLQGNNILFGNSASRNNNHIYTIQKILPENLDINIICPLAYGADAEYIKEVSLAGKKRFGQKFITFTDLIETKKYNKEVLGSCEFAILPHNRSQAWGNVMQLLWQGSKVFMFPSNNLYKFLKQKGFQIFELNKSALLNVKSFKIDVEHNRKLLKLFFGQGTIIEYYKDIISL